jgi:hypothetical protein
VGKMGVHRSVERYRVKRGEREIEFEGGNNQIFAMEEKCKRKGFCWGKLKSLVLWGRYYVWVCTTRKS